jgi:hypothetical protein
VWAPLLDRLQLKIGTVHVRFTDMPGGGAGGEDPNAAAAFGVRMDSLVVRTANSRDAAAAGGEGGGSRGRGAATTPDEGADAAAAAAVAAAAEAAAEASSRGRGRPPLPKTSTIRGLLNMVAPTEARKHVEVSGLRVYGQTVSRAAEDDGGEWHPVTGPAPPPERLRSGLEKPVEPDDVMLGAAKLTALLTVTARCRAATRDSTKSAGGKRTGSADGGENGGGGDEIGIGAGGGFNVHLV